MIWKLALGSLAATAVLLAGAAQASPVDAALRQHHFVDLS